MVFLLPFIALAGDTRHNDPRNGELLIKGQPGSPGQGCEEPVRRTHAPPPPCTPRGGAMVGYPRALSSPRVGEGHGRERIPSRLHAVSTEPDAGLFLTDHEIMT